MRGHSAAADRLDDFHPVVGGQPMLGELAARHQGLVDFHRQAASAQPLLFDQGLNTGILVKLKRLAIEMNPHIFVVNKSLMPYRLKFTTA